MAHRFGLRTTGFPYGAIDEWLSGLNFFDNDPYLVAMENTCKSRARAP